MFISKLNHSFSFSFWHREISQMDPKIDQKPITFISHHCSGAATKLRDRQTNSIATDWKK